MKIFGREPTVIVQTIGAALALVATFGIPGLSSTQAALWVAALGAVAGVVNALAVRPVAPAAFTGAAATAWPLLASYGLHLSQVQLGATQALLIAVLVLLTRTQVTPVHDPVPTAPTSGTVDGTVL